MPQVFGVLSIELFSAIVDNPAWNAGFGHACKHVVADDYDASPRLGRCSFEHRRR